MNKGKGLGRGIDALFQDIAKLEDVDVKNEQVTEILLNELRPNPYQPRKTFDETSLQELANSILHSGVFQPIIVRKSAVKGYEIIAGERRFRASKLAGKEKIPAIIREFDEESMMQVAVLENLQREDLNPLEEAEANEKFEINTSGSRRTFGQKSPVYCQLFTIANLTRCGQSNGSKTKHVNGSSTDVIRLEEQRTAIAIS